MLSEISFAARRLLRDRWSATAAVLVAGLGTGLNTAIFAVAYGVLIRPLPYRDPARLALIDVPVPFTQVDDWRRHLSSFERITAYVSEGLTIRGLAEPRFVMAAVVDDRFFETLGGAALVGRPFDASDSGPAAVLSERLARRTGIAIESLPGRSITVGDIVMTIVGVMPRAFAFPAQGTDVWIPGRAAPAIAFDKSSDARRFRLIGRLQPGALGIHASDDVLRTWRALDPEFKMETGAHTRLQSLEEALLGSTRPVLLAFTVAAGVVLVIACANVATILIGRTIARRRELAVCTALGASRARLVATIFSESMLIALSGGAVGTLLAIGGVRVFAAWATGIVPRLADVRVDAPVLAAAVFIGAVTSILAAAPAVRSIGTATITGRDGRGGRSSAVRIRTVLAASQIALAVLLLSAAGLLTQTMLRLLRGNIGVETHGALVSQLILTDATAFEGAARQRSIDALLESVRTVPGVTAAGIGSSLPPDNAPIAMSARFASGTVITETPELSLASVTPGYLEALGTRLLHGRYFDDHDERRSDPVTVLSESAARVLLPGVNPVGTGLPVDLPGMRGRGRATVVGVVGDVKYSGLESSAGPSIYVLWKELPAGQAYLALRTSGANAAAVPAMLQRLLRSAAADIPVMPIRRLDEVIERSILDRRLRAVLASSVAMLALAIAVVGVTGGLARVVSERQRELAIRSALGATPTRVLRMIIGHGAAIAGAGIAIGLLATLAVGNLLRTFLLGISPHDPATLAFVALFVGVSSLLACYVPARRAAATNPLDMLREE